MSVAHRLAGSQVVARCAVLRRIRRTPLPPLVAEGAGEMAAPTTSLADDLKLFGSTFFAGFLFLTVYLA